MAVDGEIINVPTNFEAPLYNAVQQTGSGGDAKTMKSSRNLKTDLGDSNYAAVPIPITLSSEM